MTDTWKEVSNSITKEFIFDNFAQALAFVNSVGALAESADHHPDILIHDYKKVTITLTTHSEGKVTDKDTNLAEKIDSLTLR
ncbi:MAG: 4a-hydroxytetrahydrobiopterin dehydratase [Candidatus Roizmanbacteria bacterium]|nr:4a-hydroxytetrahydrobiopterin dehydratase [Candidatus Roizmanbacteria bacterium]